MKRAMAQRRSLSLCALYMAAAMRVCAPTAVVGQLINAADKSALLELKVSGNWTYPTWSYMASWSADLNTCTEWQGVTCNANGRVVELSLSNNQLSGSIPESITKLQSLEYLYLSGNQLNGSIPESISRLYKLKFLYLFFNQLSGSIPESIGNLTNLYALPLDGNRFTGRIPESIGNLRKLQTLLLSNNQLTGSIPESISNLRNLDALFLQNNHLSGSIPGSIGNLTKMRDMYLNNNQLTGSIPESINKLHDMRVLFLKDNQLSGSIPDSISNLKWLQTLSLANNQLSGRIPESMSNLQNLEFLDFRDNYFTGPLRLHVSSPYSYFDRNYLSGPLEITFGLNRPFCTSAAGNCIYSYDTKLGCGTDQPQRSLADCQRNCNSEQPKGACGGHGTCSMDTLTCVCDAGSTLVDNSCSLSVLPSPANFTYGTFPSSEVICQYSAVIVDGTTVQLTPDFKYRTGIAYYRNPIELVKDDDLGCHAASFSTKFSFRISSLSDRKADGITFFLLTSNANMSDFGRSTGGSLAYSYLRTPPLAVGSVAITFDIFGNIDLGEPAPHVGIRENFKRTAALQESPLLSNLTSALHAWVDYDGGAKLWRVYLSSEASSKPSAPLLTRKAALCDILRLCGDCRDVTSAYVGFTAATGGVISKQELLTWDFQSSWSGDP